MIDRIDSRVAAALIVGALFVAPACKQDGAAKSGEDTPAKAEPAKADTKADDKKPAAAKSGDAPAKKDDAKKTEEPAKPAGEVKKLTSKDFTEIEPDAAETAKTPTKAEDLARFTSDLGEGKLKATITTNMGEFDCDLYEKESPITVANFVGLARGLKAWTATEFDETMRIPGKRPIKELDPVVGVPLYQDILCHRVIPNFMIQCGDPTGTGMSGPGYNIPDEFAPGLKHEGSGILSMANAGPNTGGSQFFITEVSTPHLNNRHTVFGKCNNEPLVKKIARVRTGMQNRPVDPVKIQKITVYRGEKK